MDKEYFKKIRILDGGMGQELLARGLVSKGTLWSASAILEKKFHNLVTDVHLSFINAGAEVIVTNTFVGRKILLSTKNFHSLRHRLPLGCVVLASCPKKGKDPKSEKPSSQPLKDVSPLFLCTVS